MLKRALTFIQYKTSWLAILLLLAITLLMMFLMNGTQLPFSNPTIVEHSGGLALLDLRKSYSPDDAYELFTALGAAGRRAYLTLHLGPDMIFPVGYALTFAFIAAWFLVRLLPLEHRLQWLIMVPLICFINLFSTRPIPIGDAARMLLTIALLRRNDSSATLQFSASFSSSSTLFFNSSYVGFIYIEFLEPDCQI